MLRQWTSPMFCICVLVLLLSASLAQGGSIPEPQLCFQANPPDDGNGGLSFRSSWETDFNNSSRGCGGVFDGILGGGRWARVASAGLQVSRLMFGLDLDVKKFIQFARNLGIAPQPPDRPGIGPPDSQREEDPHIKSRSSLVFRASRKKIFLGFGLKW